jgi:uncharacterized protein DUF6263
MAKLTKLNGRVRSCAAPPIAKLVLGFPALMLLALLLALPTARAQDPDDQYVQVFALIQQADALDSKGESAAALAKYRRALGELDSLRNEHPDWNAQVMSFRMNYLTQKVTALTEKISAAQVKPAAGEQTTPAEAGNGAPSSAVKLLDPGAEPRQVLRLHPKAGDKQTLSTTLRMAMDVKVGEMENPATKLPAMKLTMDATVKSVTAEGDITYETLMQDADVAADAGASPEIAEAMKGSLAKLKGLSSSRTMSSRGINIATEVKAPEGANAQMRQVMDQLKESLNQIVAPLPEEPVGVGAKWEAKMQVKSEGMTISQTATYQVVSLEGEHLATKATIVQSAANQQIQSPAMPGLKVNLTKMTGAGNGEMKFDLARTLPVEATMESHTELSMAMNLGGQNQAMTMKIDMNLRSEGK